MPATGKKFATEDQLNAKIKMLEQKIDALKNNKSSAALGGATAREFWVVTGVFYDGAGHITSVTASALRVVDGVIMTIS